MVIESYGKEIVSLLVPIMTWVLNRYFRAAARIQISKPHEFTFLLPEPMYLHNDKEPKRTVQTTSYLLRNSGRATATNIEAVFNWAPNCINIWPPRHHEHYQEDDGRSCMRFPSLAPGEVIGFEVLTIIGQQPELITVRSDQCMASYVDMQPQPIVSKSVQSLLVVLLGLGMAAAVYLIVTLVQFLVLKTPLGH